MFNEFHSDLLDKLECRLPILECSVKGSVMGSTSDIPSLCFLQALEIVLILQLCNKSIVGSKLSFSGEALGYWRRDAVLLWLGHCHDGCVDAPIGCSGAKGVRICLKVLI